MFKNLTKEQRDQKKKEKKNSQTQCSQCPNQLTGLLKQKTFCVFCLNFVCKTHIVKKRQDPIIQDKLSKICNECEENILWEKIMLKHKKKENKLLEQNNEFQQILSDLNQQIQDISIKHSQTTFQINQDQIDCEKKQQKLNQLLKDADIRSEQLNEEAKQLNDKHKLLIEAKQKVELQRQNNEQLLNQKKEEDAKIKNEKKLIDDELQEIQNQISQLNEKRTMQQTKQKTQNKETLNTDLILTYDSIQIDDDKQPNKKKSKGKQIQDKSTHLTKGCCGFGFK